LSAIAVLSICVRFATSFFKGVMVLWVASWALRCNV